ncbi:MAG: ShlB/FhaC/HecB family hemolysin secretion/activation protein [Sedimentisphaerales bacterium]|nr:ShlB/FhaC/HecB family hemolysin secretion/activation protein [Sedimentisphaerales bacterium]
MKNRKTKLNIVFQFLMCLLLLGGAVKAVESTEPVIGDANWYGVSEFVFEYKYNGKTSLPVLDELAALEIELYEQAAGYSGDKTGERMLVTLSSLSMLEKHSYHLTAIKSIQDQIVKYYNREGIGGVVVMPASGQIDMTTLADMRNGAVSGPQPFKIEIWVARVTGVSVQNISSEPEKHSEPNQVSADRPMSDSMAKIMKYSPICKSGDKTGAEESVSDILKTDELEDYLYRLNRHPGRRVDVAVGPGEKSGDVELDYNVRSNKPWLAYMQLSNAGSKDTDDFRQRYGFMNNQLSGDDDILNLDYMTTDFQTVQSLSMSYDRPWYDSRDVRFRFWLSWSDYLSSEIGPESYFSGEEKTVGFELRDNIYQNKRLFIDHFAGVRVSGYQIDNYIAEGSEVKANETFLVPRFGYRLEHDSGIRRSFGELMLEGNLIGNNELAMQSFGRMGAESNWYKMSWNFSHSFYLEPLLDPEGWRDITTPKSSTLAHELAFSTSGQWTKDRLIPQEKQSAGGLYSVRGYRQGFVSGDTVITASGEYRYHIPRGFDLAKPVTMPVFGNKFRWAPEQVYGLPDWDLVFRFFIDSAMVFNNDRRANEDNYSLLSSGAGLELQLSRYFSIRFDLGVPLLKDRNTNGDEVEVGEPQVHISGMLAY